MFREVVVMGSGEGNGRGVGEVELGSHRRSGRENLLVLLVCFADWLWVAIATT